MEILLFCYTNRESNLVSCRVYYKQIFGSMENFNLNSIGSQLWNVLLLVLYALFALVVGFWIVSKLTKIFDALLTKKDIDHSLQKFLVRILNIGLKVLVLISVAGLVGIPTTSFVTIIGAAGLAVGLALQGSLSNFAGGILILFLKPFKVGDFIEGAGHSGTVTDISIFYTYMNTPKNQAVIVPNSQLSSNTIVNYNTNDKRRLDLVFGIDYGDDIDKARSVLKLILDSDDRILDDPLYLIAVDTLGNSSVNIIIKVWCKNEDYWDLNYYIIEKVKKEFDANDISFPFPQTDVHLKKN